MPAAQERPIECSCRNVDEQATRRASWEVPPGELRRRPKVGQRLLNHCSRSSGAAPIRPILAMFGPFGADAQLCTNSVRCWPLAAHSLALIWAQCGQGLATKPKHDQNCLSFQSFHRSKILDKLRSWRAPKLPKHCSRSEVRPKIAHFGPMCCLCFPMLTSV